MSLKILIGEYMENIDIIKNKTIGQGWDIVNKGELIDINTL